LPGDPTKKSVISTLCTDGVLRPLSTLLRPRLLGLGLNRDVEDDDFCRVPAASGVPFQAVSSFGVVPALALVLVVRRGHIRSSPARTLAWTGATVRTWRQQSARRTSLLHQREAAAARAGSTRGGGRHTLPVSFAVARSLTRPPEQLQPEPPPEPPPERPPRQPAQAQQLVGRRRSP